jgi:hypothetical protein
MASEFIPVALVQLWQVTLLILVVAAVNRWFGQRRPHLSHLLWMVVLIKCVTPPLWASPGGVFCWLQPEQQVETLVEDTDEWTSRDWGELLDADAFAAEDSIDSSDTFAGIVLDEPAVAELLPPENHLAPAPTPPINHQLRELAVAFWLGVSLIVLFGVTVRWLRFWKLVQTSPQRSSPELEVLHIRRGDLWVGLLQTLAQALWWFHPLVWWVGRLTTREAERCCDEEVLGELKCDPASYARALLDVLDLKSQLKPVLVFPGGKTGRRHLTTIGEDHVAETRMSTQKSMVVLAGGDWSGCSNTARCSVCSKCRCPKGFVIQ